ncbi:MAG: hypothetical protein MZV49_08880 [Rhodopseudomonas palustris]|nr:hypothetical protein [Rhodopseudomonas palustris]
MFSWESAADAASYVFEAASDPAFASTVATVETQDAFVRLKAELGPGTYRWRVRYRTADGASSPASSPRTFVVVPKAAPPEAVSPPDGTVVEEGTSDSCVLRLEGRVGSLEVRAVRVEGPVVADRRADDRPAPGVRARAGAGNLVLVGTRGRRRRVGIPFVRSLSVVARLPAPRLVSPEDGARVKIGAAATAFAWSAVEGAGAYRFTLASRDGRIAAETKVAATTVSIDPSRLESGSYSWTVAAESADGRRAGPASAGTSSWSGRGRRCRPRWCRRRMERSWKDSAPSGTACRCAGRPPRPGRPSS